MEQTKRWWASKTIWSSIVVLLAVVASAAGYEITAAEQAEITDYIFSGVAAVGALGAIVGRIVAEKKISSETEETTE